MPAADPGIAANISAMIEGGPPIRVVPLYLLLACDQIMSIGETNVSMAARAFPAVIGMVCPWTIRADTGNQ